MCTVPLKRWAFAAAVVATVDGSTGRTNSLSAAASSSRPDLSKRPSWTDLSCRIYIALGFGADAALAD